MAIVLFKSFFTTLLIYFAGISFSRLFLKIKDTKNIFEQLFIGFFVIGFLSVFLNFFLPLSKVLNSLIFILFAIYSLTHLKNNEIKNLKINVILIFLISLLAAILIFKSDLFRPDAGLYHLPFTKILNEEKLILGLSNLHFRFGHASILQYINATNNNFIQNEIGVIFPISILVSTFVIFLFFEVKKITYLKDRSYQYLLILILFFSITFLERYSDYGNDAAGFIYSILCIIYFFKIQNLNSEDDIKKFNLLILFSVFAFLNKTFLILFLILPLLLVNKKYLFEIFKNRTVIFSSIFLILWFIKNILLTGCIIYPSPSTCFNFLWTDIEKIKYYNIAGEAAAKGYLDIIKYKILDTQIEMYEFNKNFYWFKIWSEFHLFKIIEKILPLLIFILLIFLYKFFSKKSENRLINKKIYDLFFFTLFGTAIWFYKFPLYRYGTSYLILLIIILIVIIFSKLKFSFLKKKELIFLSYFFVIIFLGLNFNRIFKSFQTHENLANIYSMGKIISYKKKTVNNQYYYFADSECMYTKNLCTHLNVKLKFIKKLNYKIFY